jgi:citronellol/citronellal dehydrogenase
VTPEPKSQQIYRPELFSEKVAVITGGGSGIGLATAEEFLRLGAKVAICGRTAAKLDAAKEALGSRHDPDSILAAPCDIRDAERVAAFVGDVLAQFGRIDILVNNAGGQFPSPAQSISANGFAAVVNNNLNGTFNMTREVANQWMLENGGRVINIIANIYRGFPGMAHTGAARAGVENLTMTLAVEWARKGILVNAIAPGVIISSGTAQYPKAILDHAVETCPVHRAGTVDEVAAAILFLASPAAQFITGATLRIDGGHSLSGEIWKP